MKVYQMCSVPFKVLRNTTRRGHRLYDKTENDRQIILVDDDFDGKIEIEKMEMKAVKKDSFKEE